MSSVEILADVASRVFEDCAFLSLDPAETVAFDTHDALASTITITADQQHVLKLVASRPLLVEAAANMLGVESDDAEAFRSAEQAISELLNVVAGSLAARLYGTLRECALGLPQRADPQAPAGDEGVVVMMRTDGDAFLRLELR